MKQRFPHRFVAYQRRIFVMSLILLIPVLVIALVNYGMIHQQNNVAVENNLRFDSQRHLELMARQMEIIRRVTDQHRKDDGFYTWDQTSLLATYFDVQEALCHDVVWLSPFSNACYYNAENGYVISQRGMEDEGFYFSEVAAPGGVVKIKSTIRSDRTVPIRIQSLLYNKKGVMFCVPFEINAENQPVTFLLFTIFDNDLNPIWKNDYGDGSFATLFYEGIPFFSTNQKVNDQIYQHGDISAMIDFPDTDKLYRYSDHGISVQWNISKMAFIASEVGLVTKQALVTFLVLTIGFTLFLYYSRKSYRPLQNIIKNIPQQYKINTDMDEATCLDAALSDLAYSKSFLEATNHELQQEKYLYYILDNQVKPDGAVFRQCLDAGIRVDRRFFACILVDDTEENQVLYEFLTNGVKPKEMNLYSIYIMGNKYLFLLCADGRRGDLESFLKRLPEIEKGYTTVSEIVEGISNVREAYASVCLNETRPFRQAIPERYPELELESLEEAVSVDNTDKVEFSLRMIKNNLSCYSENLRIFVFAVICDIIGEGDREKIGRWVRAIVATDFKSVSSAIDELFSCWSREKQAQQSLISRYVVARRLNLSNILQYIQRNFDDPRFSIKCMAAEFGTSQSNLSHYFKKITGKTLSGLIDEMRIKKAEEYLTQGEKVGVVAKKVGYNSSSVFIDAFKRLRGVTPNAYRSGEIKSAM